MLRHNPRPHSWEFYHICTHAEILPDKFFQDSPFGMSPANPARSDETIARSNLNIDRFRQLGFPASFCNTLTTGVPLLMKEIPQANEIHNYSSIYEHESFARETVQKWQDLGFFIEVTQRPHIVNPLGVVVRHGKHRLVLDATATGLNDCLIKPKFHLPTHREIIATMSHGDFMAKADFKNGFLQLPIRTCEQTFIGFKHPFKDTYCVFVRLPFGLGPATFLFQTFSSCVKQCLMTVFGIDLVVYIDDWLLKDTSEEVTSSFLQKFTDICGLLGITINPEKSEGPLRTMQFLGLTIDTMSCTLSLPEEKRLKYAAALDRMLSADEHTMDELAQMAGMLVHVAAVHTRGWTHIQPLWEALYKHQTEWTKKELRRAKVQIDDELLSCLSWWLEQFQHTMKRRIWKLKDNRLQLWEAQTAATDTANAMTIITDASSSGWGAVINTLTLEGRWSKHQATLSNNWRETRAIVNAISRWIFVKDERVLILTDNSIAVAVVNARKLDATGLKQLAEELTQLENVRKIQVVALHIPGVLNDLPDALSRQKSTWIAKPMSIDLAPLQRIVTPSVVLGVEATAAMPRYTPLPPPIDGFVIAISTPDIPFLTQHLKRWATA